MNVVLLSYGTRGDVEPFLALACGFQTSGHSVRLAGPEPFAPMARARGIEYIPLPGDPDELAASLVGRAGTSWARMVPVMADYILPLAIDVLERLEQGAQGADTIVHSFLMTQAGHELAVRQRIPDVSAQLFPIFSSTTAFPGVVFPDVPLGPIYRRLTHAIVDQTFHLGGRYLYSVVRRRRPGLPRLNGWPFSGQPPHDTPILFGFSPAVIPPPRDWPSSKRVTGYWVLDPKGEDSIDPQLVAFIEAGPAPVYIGFGSMIAAKPATLKEAAMRALGASGQRGILAWGKEMVMSGSPSPDVLFVESVPHAWLFPQMAAVVHHGGAGTTAAGFRAGVPQVIVPFTADQGFWGRRVHFLGAGPKPIPLPRLTAGRLAEAIRLATTDPGMRLAARSLAERIAEEDGVAQAVEFVERRAEVANARSKAAH